MTSVAPSRASWANDIGHDIVVSLNWNDNAPSGLAGYNVYRSASANGTYQKLNATLLTASQYADATAPQGTSYYRVIAVGTDGQQSAPAQTSATMAIKFRGGFVGIGADHPGLTVAKPTGLAADDVMIASVSVLGSATVIAPPGWSLVETLTNGTLGQSVYLHTATGGEPVSYAWRLSISRPMAVALSAYRGIDPQYPLDVPGQRANATGTAVVAPSVAATVNNGLLVIVSGIATNATFTPPAGATEQAEILLSPNKQKIAGSIADQLLAAAGSTGTRTTIASKSEVSVGQAIVLRPTGLTAPPDTTPPSKPTGLNAVGVSTSRINLSWTASTDNVAVVGYRIYRDTVLIDTVPGTAYGDTGLAAGSSHTYQIAAIDAVPNVSDLSDAKSATTLAAPTGIAFRGASSASAKSASSLTIARPSAAVTGDVLIASLDVRASVTPAQVTADGWQLVRFDTAGTALTKLTYWRALVAGQAASYVFTLPSAMPVSGVIVAYSGVDSANAIEAQNGMGSATSSQQIIAPSVTTLSQNAMVVGLYAVAASATFTPPNTMTERLDVALSSGSLKVSSEASDIRQTAAGATSARVATSTGAGANVGQLIALKPAS